jgi:thiosulfate reductase cytochrome b subunit
VYAPAHLIQECLDFLGCRQGLMLSVFLAGHAPTAYILTSDYVCLVQISLQNEHLTSRLKSKLIRLKQATFALVITVQCQCHEERQLPTARQPHLDFLIWSTVCSGM